MVRAILILFGLLSCVSAAHLYLIPRVTTFVDGYQVADWKQPDNWVNQYGKAVNRVPSSTDVAHIAAVGTDCSSIIGFVNSTVAPYTKVGSLVVGRVVVGADQCRGSLATLIVNGKLSANSATVRNLGELRLGPQANLNLKNQLTVMSGGYLGGSGIVTAPNTIVNGTLNPYNEAALQQQADLYRQDGPPRTEPNAAAASYGAAGNFQFSGNLSLFYASVFVDLGGYGRVRQNFDSIYVGGTVSVQKSTIMLATTVDGDLSYRLFDGPLIGRETGDLDVSTEVYGGSFYKHLFEDPDSQRTQFGYNPSSSVNGLYGRSASGATATTGDRSRIEKRGSISVNICSKGGFGLLLTSQACPVSCPAGYSSPPDCSVTTCNYDCNGCGSCKGLYPNAPFCACNPTHVGAYCQQASCSGNCNNHGSCVNVVNAYCDCGKGWTGSDCAIPVCQPYCGPHGKCMGGNVAEPYCLCNDGYYGTDCSKAYQSCGSGCINGGNCNFKTGTCNCTAQFTGSSCQKPFCTPACGAKVCVVNANGQPVCQSP